MAEQIRITDTDMLDWVEHNRPQICRVRISECSGDYFELDTSNGTWRGKTLRNAIRSAIRKEPCED